LFDDFYGSILEIGYLAAKTATLDKFAMYKEETLYWNRGDSNSLEVLEPGL
jgi:hypothetical protein